jgi:capsule polysaccharide export protein KpsE/RkpR
MDSLPKRQATKEDELLRDYKQEDITTKSKPNRSDTAAREPMRTLRVIGAAAALLAVLGIVVLVICLLIRLPRF